MSQNSPLLRTFPEPRQFRLALQIRIEDDPESGDVAPTIQRLKHLLKRLLRGYGFRCVSAEEVSRS